MGNPVKWRGVDAIAEVSIRGVFLGGQTLLDSNPTCQLQHALNHTSIF